jgi:hypothetical protein
MPIDELTQNIESATFPVAATYRRVRGWRLGRRASGLQDKKMAFGGVLGSMTPVLGMVSARRSLAL